MDSSLALEPSLPLPLGRPQRVLVLRLLHQGIACAGEFGWTAADWAHRAAVPGEILHAALEGRLTDERGGLRLLAALGVRLAAAADAVAAITVQLPLELHGAGGEVGAGGGHRAAPLLTIACAHCHRRGALEHHQDGAAWRLRCTACQAHRPFALEALGQAAAPPAFA